MDGLATGTDSPSTKAAICLLPEAELARLREVEGFLRAAGGRRRVVAEAGGFRFLLELELVRLGAAISWRCLK